MSKPADLRQVMNASAKAPPRRSGALKVEMLSKTAKLKDANAAKNADDVQEKPHARPGRAGKSNVTGYFPPEVKKQLRLLAAEQETTIQRLLAEALNGLFASHNKPEIAPIQDD